MAIKDENKYQTHILVVCCIKCLNESTSTNSIPPTRKRQQIETMQIQARGKIQLLHITHQISQVLDEGGNTCAYCSLIGIKDSPEYGMLDYWLSSRCKVSIGHTKSPL